MPVSTLELVLVLVSILQMGIEQPNGMMMPGKWIKFPTSDSFAGVIPLWRDFFFLTPVNKNWIY